MNFRIYYCIGTLIGIVLLFSGCISTNEVKSEKSEPVAIEIHDDSLRLADYLRRVNGVMIHETGNQVKVTIRGNLSFNTNSEPLYVINGIRSGHDYNRIEGVVPVASIYSVEVLKGSDASAQYGLAGSNGAIVIRTK